VQVLLSDVHARYVHLLEALEAEVKRRQEAMNEQQEKTAEDASQQGGQQQQQQKLVPPVAELILLKRLEEDVLVELKAFRIEDSEYRDEVSRTTRLRILERLGHRHSSLTEIFDDLIEAQTGQPLGEPEEDTEGDER